MRKILAVFAALTLGLGGVLALAAPANAAEECTTETTGWVLESPGKGWVQVDERTVVDQEATEDETVISGYQHYSWTGGRSLVTDPPTVVPPDEDWQANTTKEPKGHLNSATCVAPATPETGGLHYTANSKGFASWFYLEVFYTTIPGEEEVTHQEYKFEKTTCVDEPVDPEDPKDPEEPNTPQNKPPTELPGTGASDVLPWAGLGLVVLLTGLLTHMVITRRSKSLI